MDMLWKWFQLNRRKAVLIRRQPDPTDDLYVGMPLARLRNAPRLRTIDLVRSPSPAALDSADMLIISRYITSPLLDRLRERREAFGRLIYLVDDDLPEIETTEQLPPAATRDAIPDRDS